MNRQTIPVRFQPHIACCVSDRMAAVALYTSALGAELVDDGDGETLLDVGDLRLYLEECRHEPAIRRGPGHVWLAFESTDAKSVLAAFVDAGAHASRVEPQGGWLIEDPFGLCFFLSEQDVDS